MLDINEIFENELPFDGHYKLLDILSTDGGSADVWLAIDMNTIDESGDESKATKVVIKIYRPKNMIDIEGEYQFRKEFKQVFGCHHENIIQPTYFSIFEESPYLVLPYCPAGSSELLVGELRTGKDLWKYISDVASGLAYLHEHTPQIIHQDIKPANVLIDDNGNYAITDFGISAAMGGADVDSEDETGGTYAYMAPERFLEGTPPKPESDIWAFGATLYELVTGDAPYGNDGGSRQKKGEKIPAIKQKIPEHIKQLIYDCLAYEPKERPTARKIVDTVLKKRYSRNKRTIALIVAAMLIIGAAIAYLVVSTTHDDPNRHLDSLIASGDSIVNVELKSIEADSANEENIAGLEKAKVLYSKVEKDATPDFDKKELIYHKIETINLLIVEIREFDRANDLAEKAQITDMEEEYLENKEIADQHYATINNLIQQLK